ncbi:MAG TPA: hypothetical protein VJ728_09515 [Candidatus Binataceae bacterium]|nr:hypothetical protein [Candidatus Binataceae bacterium]
MADIRIDIREMFHEQTVEERRIAAWNRMLAANEERERRRDFALMAANAAPSEPDRDDPIALLAVDSWTREEIYNRLGNKRQTFSSGPRSRIQRMVAQDTRIRSTPAMAQPWRGPVPD